MIVKMFRSVGIGAIMPKYLWKPILPLRESDRQIDLAAMQQIYETWYYSKEYLQKASPSNLKAFNERLFAT